MHRSHVIEVDGVFMGAALWRSDAAGCVFVAARAEAQALDGTWSSDLAEIRERARLALLLRGDCPAQPAS